MSVVMPFAGTVLEAAAALEVLAGLRVTGDDELILADNTGTAPPREGVIVVGAAGERSPSRARNAGAQRARAEWILFIDADCHAPADLIERYFDAPVDDGVGALAGAVVPTPGATSLAGRYGAARSFLDQGAHLAHPYMPRAVAANLLVRRAAFEQIGGFYEGLRAAEDTDFSWRLQRAGWRLEARPGASVEHRYRQTLRGLRRQWRGYAAGRAWLARRYDGFAPEPAVRRAARRVRRRPAAPPPPVAPAPPVTPAPPVAAVPDGARRPGPLSRGGFRALDAVLGLDELVGFALSNRPSRDGLQPARVVLVADRFPACDDPLAEFAASLAGVRVEAARRPERIAAGAARDLPVDYREDDGAAARALAAAWLLVRHPLRCSLDLARRRRLDDPGLPALAPAVLRLRREPAARIQQLGGVQARRDAVRLAALAGRRRRRS
ncbi:MAG: glycosyltransferase family 2 protein [Solirubrobacteraceae bacterium]